MEIPSLLWTTSTRVASSYQVTLVFLRNWWFLAQPGVEHQLPWHSENTGTTFKSFALNARHFHSGWDTKNTVPATWLGEEQTSVPLCYSHDQFLVDVVGNGPSPVGWTMALSVAPGTSWTQRVSQDASCASSCAHHWMVVIPTDRTGTSATLESCPPIGDAIKQDMVKFGFAMTKC